VFFSATIIVSHYK